MPPSAEAPANGSSQAKQHQPNRAYQTPLPNFNLPHLKKKDAEALWRRDIQYDFLCHVFHDQHKVFTNTYDGSTGNTFADVYVDAMVRSSKTSKVLREKLSNDRQAGLDMAMTCLLVNLGRMNTTFNFHIEMRAQMRTYHSIPALQAHGDNKDSKQIQDAPRLKSILKGACDDRPEPSTLEELKEFGRTNPINLVFLLSSFQSKLKHYFPKPYEFHDLIMNDELSSASRGRGFLWLMYTFLESSEAENPFGDKTADNQTRVPDFQELTPEEAKLENADTPEEQEFGEAMRIKRETYLQDDSKKATENGDAQSSDGSTTKSKSSAVNLKLILKAPGRSSKTSEGLKTQNAARELKCQRQVHKIMKSKTRRRKRARYQRGPLVSEWDRIHDLDPVYDSDPELQLDKKPGKDQSSAFGDYGEESSAMAVAFRRSLRWLQRWDPELTIKPALHPPQTNRSQEQRAREQMEVALFETLIEEHKRREQERQAEQAKENVASETPQKPARRTKKRKATEMAPPVDATASAEE